MSNDEFVRVVKNMDEFKAALDWAIEKCNQPEWLNIVDKIKTYGTAVSAEIGNSIVEGNIVAIHLDTETVTVQDHEDKMIYEVPMAELNFIV